MTVNVKAAHEQQSCFVDIVVDGRDVRIEYALIEAAEGSAAPLLVFLHEGLGSVSMWRDFPWMLCAATGMRGMMYSRPGYGRSTPPAPDERWPVDFMQRQAQVVLPALLDTLAIDAPVWLFGHSDGGSIALLFAAAYPTRTLGLVVVAPHIVVEEISIASIEAARRHYDVRAFKARLARYHDDPDSAFRGWSDVWLDPAFRDWTIEADVARITCPLLAVQGTGDEYGTMAQVDGISSRAFQSCVVKLDGAGHSPHRDQPEQLIAAVVAFLRAHGGTSEHGC
ncbi:MAG: alpha/beta hydrolase [Betaproteobacteria bacterium]